MARFLFVIWDGGGSVPPMLGLAQELRARGHAVAFAGQELGEDRAPLLALPSDPSRTL